MKITRWDGLRALIVMLTVVLAAPWFTRSRLWALTGR
jgi:hypothetical protein